MLPLLAFVAVCALPGCMAGDLEPEPVELELFTLNGIWANQADDIWVVGSLWYPSDDSAVVHYDGVGWSRVAELGGTLTEIGGSGPDDVWVLQVRRDLTGQRRTHWRRGSADDGFREEPLPVPGADIHSLLGGTRDGVWLLTASHGDTLWIDDLRIWRHDGLAWTEVAASAGGFERTFHSARDGEGRVWIVGQGQEPREPVLERWSATGGWESVPLPPGVGGRGSLQVDDTGRLHMVAGRVYRYDETRWTALTEEPDEDVRIARGHTVTPHGIWTIEHRDHSTSCTGISTCGRTTTDSSHGLARLDRPGDADFLAPVGGTCGEDPCFVQESAEEAWMITANLIWRIEPL